MWLVLLLDPSSRECSEGVSPDKHLTLPKHIAMVPLGVASGVASFTSDNIHIPGNASSAVSNTCTLLTRAWAKGYSSLFVCLSVPNYSLKNKIQRFLY